MEKQRMISERDDCLKNLEQDHRVKVDIRYFHSFHIISYYISYSLMN